MKNRNKQFDEIPASVYSEVEPVITPTGLKPINANGDIFLDAFGRVWTLERSLMSGDRVLVLHDRTIIV